MPQAIHISPIDNVVVALQGKATQYASKKGRSGGVQCL